MRASSAGYTSTVEVLLEAGAKPDLHDSVGVIDDASVHCVHFACDHFHLSGS
jgi:hypothetical protein